MDISFLAQLTVVGKIALAMLLSAFVGYEREVKDRPAGLRTHMLVGGGMTMFTAISDYLIYHMILVFSPDKVSITPDRIIQSVLTGIGFLGAGTILKVTAPKGGEKVHGLTTAATILFVAGIGICVGAEGYYIAVGATLLALFVLRGVDSLERRIGTKRRKEIPASADQPVEKSEE